jgi:hypothetical protein
MKSRVVNGTACVISLNRSLRKVERNLSEPSMGGPPQQKFLTQRTTGSECSTGREKELQVPVTQRIPSYYLNDHANSLLKCFRTGYFDRLCVIR